MRVSILAVLSVLLPVVAHAQVSPPAPVIAPATTEAVRGAADAASAAANAAKEKSAPTESQKKDGDKK